MKLQLREGISGGISGQAREPRGRAGARTSPGHAGTARDERDQSRHGCSLLLPSSAGFIAQSSPITLICGIKEKSISIREVMCSGLTGPVGCGAAGAAWTLPVPGSMSMLGHGWQHGRQPWSHGDFPEHFFWRGSTVSACPAQKRSDLGLSPVLPTLWLGVRWWLGASRGRLRRAQHRNPGRGWGADGCLCFCRNL